MKLSTTFFPKNVAHASIGLCPAHHLGRGVRPQKVAKHSVLWHLARSLDGLDLLHVPELGRAAAVDAEDLVSHDGGKGKAVEDLNEGFEHLGAVLLLDLVVKPIDAGDGGALVVPAYHEELRGVLELVAEQEDEDLEAARTPVDVVPEEEVVALGRVPVVLKDAKEVLVLPVDVANDSEGRAEPEKGRPLEEARRARGGLHLRLVVEKPLDDAVQVRLALALGLLRDVVTRVGRRRLELLSLDVRHRLLPSPAASLFPLLSRARASESSVTEPPPWATRWR